MHVGFNHNIRYKGHLYHVQTEDCGVKRAAIVTLLYRGGTILSSNKTSYADVLNSDEFEVVIEELMKVQHKGMLRALTRGDFDHKIAAFTEEPSIGISPQAPPTIENPEPQTSDPDLDALIFSYLSGANNDSKAD